jgi:anthranilate synthase component 2/putative glutamine amidotransferase
VWQRESALLPKVYLDATVAAGAVPLLLPPAGTDPSVLDMVDALVIAGGCDVDPAGYGAVPHPLTSGTRPDRDHYEAVLIQAALARDLPLLAICRGLHLLNVTLGGTLHQHLPDLVRQDGHRPAPGVFGTNKVTTEPDSLARRLLGDVVSVPCHHHQALDRIAAPLRVAARAGDGTVEAAEVSGRRFALGVQWHPEEDPSDMRLFTALVGGDARA